MATSTGPEIFILREPTSLGDFERVAEKHGWAMVNQIQGDGQAVAFEQIRMAQDDTTTIHYLEDPVSELRFIVVQGPQAGRVAFHLGRHLGVRTSINVVRMAHEARSDAQKMASAMELAVVFKNPDPDAMAVLRGYYQGGNEPLRRRVIKALGYRGWPEAVTFLEEIAGADESEELRAHAQGVAQLWRELLAT